MKQKVKRVLIYRLGSLGDMTIALPALHLVARAFPAAERRMLTNIPVNSKAPAAAAVFGESGLVTGYIRYVVGMRDPLAIASLWWALVRWRPEVVVYLAASRGVRAARRDAWFFRLCGVRHLVGLPLTPSEQACAVDAAGDLEPEANRLARNLLELGTIDVDDRSAWDLHLTRSEHAKALDALAEVGNRPVIAVSVGTKVQSKDWGQENWQSLLREVARLCPGHALVLCGAAEEAAVSEFAAEGWREVAGSAVRVLNLCGVLTPRQSAAVFAQAKLFLGHDSGPMHLAAAVGTPCVAIFAARNLPRQWFPCGPGHQVVYHAVSCKGCALETCIVEKKRCLTSISVAEVVAAVEKVLAEVDTSAKPYDITAKECDDRAMNRNNRAG